MANFKHPASSILWNYLGILDRIYGMYTDACCGVEVFSKKIEDSIPLEQRDKILFMGSGDPNKPDATYKHAVKISDFIERNRPDGENQGLLSQSCILFVYSLWDTSIRPRYAEAIARPQVDVASNLFGDLRFYRHSILHNNSILERQPRVLNFVNVGQSILLTKAQMEQLFAMLFEDVSNLSNNFVGERFNLNFERRLNAPSAVPAAAGNAAKRGASDT